MNSLCCGAQVVIVVITMLESIEVKCTFLRILRLSALGIAIFLYFVPVPKLFFFTFLTNFVLFCLMLITFNGLLTTFQIFNRFLRIFFNSVPLMLAKLGQSFGLRKTNLFPIFFLNQIYFWEPKFFLTTNLAKSGNHNFFSPCIKIFYFDSQSDRNFFFQFFSKIYQKEIFNLIDFTEPNMKNKFFLEIFKVLNFLNFFCLPIVDQIYQF